MPNCRACTSKKGVYTYGHPDLMTALGLDWYEGTYLCARCREELNDGKIKEIRGRLEGVTPAVERDVEPDPTDDETTDYLEGCGIL